MAAFYCKFLIIVTFVLFLPEDGYGSGIPVLLWTNKDQVQYPVLLRGPALGNKDFSNGYLDQIVERADQNLVVFIQDKLSLNDITNYADVFNDNSNGATFSSVKNIMENYESTHIAKVTKPVDALKSLQRKFKGKIHTVEDIKDLDNVKLDEKEPNMLIISLPKTEGGDKKSSLKKSDDVIGRVTNDLSKKKRRFAAVYTAYEASEFEQSEHAFLGRHLLATGEETATGGTNTTNYTFFNIKSNKTENSSSCIFFYATSIKFQVIQIQKNTPNYDNHTIYEFPPLQKDTSKMTTGSVCGNNTALLMIDFKDALPEGLKEFKMAMNITTMAGFWSIYNWNLTFSGHNITDPKQQFNGTHWGMEGKNSTLYGTLPYGNLGSTGYSYHCGEQIITQANSTVLATTDLVVQMRMTEFQLQYNITNNTFGPANECVGFFTGGIWMTLIFFALMISILTFGMGLLTNIQTMDRFDDPKGKTIQVNAAE